MGREFKIGLLISIATLFVTGLTVKEFRCFLRLEPPEVCSNSKEMVTVGVIVKGENQLPLRGVNVLFLFEGPPIGKTTDEHGYVEVKIPSNKKLKMTLFKEGFEPEVHNINLEQNNSPLEYILKKNETDRDTSAVPNPNNRSKGSVKDLIETFKTKFSTSYEQYDESKKKPPSMNSTVEKLEGLIENIEKGSESLRRNDIQKPRAEFYVAFWSDFKERVLPSILSGGEEEKKECIRASSLYSDAISSYLTFFEGGGEIKAEEDFFMIIELTHRLINRDAGKGDYTTEGHEEPDNPELADGYGTALKLLDHIEDYVKNNPERSDINYAYYDTKRLIYSLKQGNYDDLKHGHGSEKHGHGSEKHGHGSEKHDEYVFKMFLDDYYCKPDEIRKNYRGSNNKWRITFKFNGVDAFDANLEDYY